MPQFSDSELIINPDGSIYHLNLRPEQIATTIITVGDPDRVEKVSQHFDRIDEKVAKREFVTHTGELNGKRISVISTGIGTDNIDIVLNELDALHNIDFQSREVKAQFTPLDIFRIGTTGGLQEHIPVDSLLLSSYGLGLDGLMHYYLLNHNANEYLLHYEFMDQCGRELNLPIRPYLVEGSEELRKQMGDGWLEGITVTCPGFYAPQGRRLRGEPALDNLLEVLAQFEFNKMRITNFEMETAGTYGLARLLGHRALSCNVILANRPRKQFSSDPKGAVERLIQKTLEGISLIK
ncbi:MAG: nucleoside phosphorylase [Bacteroidota bacterium]